MSPEEADTVASLIPNLRRYARVLVRDPDLADDLVQDCLERAITRFHCFTPGTNLRSWLFTILLNLVRSHARSAKRRGVMVPIDEIHDLAGRTAAPEQPLVMRDLQHAFDQLPGSFQEVILLVAIEGLAYETAADILDVPIGTVRSRLSRARDQLRRSLEETAPAAKEGKVVPMRRREGATTMPRELQTWVEQGWTAAAAPS